MAKPDNRADNVPHLQKAIRNTAENIEQTEQYLAEHADEISPQETDTLTEKNQRRRESIQSFKSEIQDES